MRNAYTTGDKREMCHFSGDKREMRHFSSDKREIRIANANTTNMYMYIYVYACEKGGQSGSGFVYNIQGIPMHLHVHVLFSTFV